MDREWKREYFRGNGKGSQGQKAKKKRKKGHVHCLNADMKKEAINFEIKLRRQISREKLGRKPKYEKTSVSGYNFA
jgi:hypothetical protein